MSFEPASSASAPATPGASAIENEIASYRAITPLAIVSMICGFCSLLSFASWFFIGIGVVAVVTGVLATRKIQRYPDLFTGRSFAQAGIGLGLIFSLAAVTTQTVSGMIRSSQAKEFALIYEKALRKGSTDDLVWFGSPPGFRKDKTPKQVVEEMQKSGKESGGFERQNASLFDLKKRLETPGADIHFDRIEAHDDDGRNIYASAVYRVHLPDGKTPAEKDRLALASLKAEKVEGKYTWWIDQIAFPYQAGTFVPPEAPVDDGHGHGGH